MKYLKPLFHLLICSTFIMAACQTDKHKLAKAARLDTALSRFIQLVEMEPYYDTSSCEFQLLRALNNKDRRRFQYTAEEMRLGRSTPWIYDIVKPEIINYGFDTLSAQEAYKFIYTASFCNYLTTATIIKINDKISVTAIVFKNYDSKNPEPLSVAQKVDTSIDLSSWTDFENLMIESDFWGLKSRNYMEGNDGSSIEVLGYNHTFMDRFNNRPKRHYVYRWERSMKNLLEPFKYLLKTCNITEGSFTGTGKTFCND